MRFTLTYDGPLHADSDANARISEKQAIREQIHDQLTDVWYSHPALIDSLPHWQTLPEEQKFEGKFGVHAIDRGAYRFVPLVTKAEWLVCELDVVFLRRESDINLVNTQGDLDNRIKVLFDALAVPKYENQLPPTARPKDHQRPFFCLLEDDDRITAFRIDSRRLHDSQTRPERRNWARLIIDVNVKVTRLTWGNLGMGGD